MLSNDSLSARQSRRGDVSRSVISIVLLMAIIGGLAWVVQYLPSIKRTGGPIPNTDKPLLLVTPKVAIWRTPGLVEKKDADSAAQGLDGYKEFEQGKSGHYDFLIRNASGADLEVRNYTSACDCASVNISVLAADEFGRVSKHHAEQPGEPLPYTKEPSWHELSKDETKAKSLTMKADEVGVIRVGWVARQTPGQPLKVYPTVWFQSAGDTVRKSVVLPVPIMVQHAVQFYPSRLHVGVLVPDIDPNGELTGAFDAWSSTREKLDLKLTTLGTDPFVTIEARPLAPKECADLEESLKSKKIDTRVRSAARVSVKVVESKDGRRLELGSFYRQLLVHLDGEPRQDIRGPEIVGRVDGAVVIGGAADDKRIRFRSFAAAIGSSRTIDLIAPADMKLETFKHEPSWLEVKLTLDEMNIPGKRRTWRLQVTVPPGAPMARSFEEPNAVVLRMVGSPERFVRIPVEGHVISR